MRFRITLRAGGLDLRGYLEGNEDELRMFASLVHPLQVIASPADASYNPHQEATLTAEALTRIVRAAEAAQLAADTNEEPRAAYLWTSDILRLAELDPERSPE